MFVSEKFLDFLKTNPKEVIRVDTTENDYYNGLHRYYLVKMNWVVDRTTINIVLKDTGSFSADKVPTLILQSVSLAKKKYYGLYTSRTEIDRNNFTINDRKEIVDALASHYFDKKEENWKKIADGGPTVDDYL